MKRIATTCDGRHAQVDSPKAEGKCFALRSLLILRAIRLGLDHGERMGE